jgi:hypothetical protein
MEKEPSDKNKILFEQEFKFLHDLKDLSKQLLIEASLKLGTLPEGFDMTKGLNVLERALFAEIDYLCDEPDHYIELYGNTDVDPNDKESDPF